eukprot:TRINITY_DN66787_c0_g1_i1.p1 TRINITY_DN66787_c0_g1~~TRINITY_DN66787_c0_g1_i1.p1  ORF type:complete len:218 (-),score=39.77 TRINITY_DN66787_c0_g1_i1:31-684(-)
MSSLGGQSSSSSFMTSWMDSQNNASSHLRDQTQNPRWRLIKIAGGVMALVVVICMLGGQGSRLSSSKSIDVVSYVAVNASLAPAAKVSHALDDLEKSVATLQDRIRLMKEGLRMCGKNICAEPEQCCFDRNCCAPGMMCCDGNCCAAGSTCCHGTCCPEKDAVCCENGLCGAPGSVCEDGVILERLFPNRLRMSKKDMQTELKRAERELEKYEENKG